MSDIKPLEIDEINAFVKGNDTWSYEDNRLKAKFEFETFEQAIEVLNKVADISAEMNHHPLITNVYNQLMFSITTHGAGNKVTELDIKLAQKVEEAVAETTKSS